MKAGWRSDRGLKKIFKSAESAKKLFKKPSSDGTLKNFSGWRAFSGEHRSFTRDPGSQSGLQQSSHRKGRKPDEDETQYTFG